MGVGAEGWEIVREFQGARGMTYRLLRQRLSTDWRYELEERQQDLLGAAKWERVSGSVEYAPVQALCALLDPEVH